MCPPLSHAHWHDKQGRGLEYTTKKKNSDPVAAAHDIRLRLAAHTLRLPRRAQHTLARAQHTLASLPARVRIYELGARDGLQNEQRIVDAATKIELIHRLARMGASSVETTSFVSARAVPQMADCEAVMAGVEQRAGTDYRARARSR